MGGAAGVQEGSGGAHPLTSLPRGIELLSSDSKPGLVSMPSLGSGSRPASLSLTSMGPRARIWRGGGCHKTLIQGFKVHTLSDKLGHKRVRPVWTDALMD